MAQCRQPRPSRRALVPRDSTGAAATDRYRMTSPLSPLAALASAASLGAADFGGGLASRRTSAASVIVGTELCGLIALPVALALLPVRWVLPDLAVALTGGVLAGIGLVLFYRAMLMTQIGVVAPISGVVAAALPTALGLLAGDPLRPLQLSGIVLGLIAIALVNGSGHRVDSRNGGTLLAFLAGLCFGGFFVLFHAASGSGAAAFVSGRVGTESAALLIALLSRASPIPRREAWRVIALAGVLDGTGSTLYLAASRGGLLSVTAVLASFYPAVTVLCARLFTTERLGRPQVVGVAFAVVAAALIAIG